MKVRFRVNLGTTDAARLDIANVRECLAGNEVDVKESAAKVLVQEGIAVLVAVVPPIQPEPKPVELQADPKSEPDAELSADPVKKKK